VPADARVDVPVLDEDGAKVSGVRRLDVLRENLRLTRDTPATLPSGSFHGMVLSTLLGDGAVELVPEDPLVPGQVVLTGIRQFEPLQREYLEEAAIRWHGVDDFERALESLVGPVYLHVDLDVLDPSEFTSVGYSSPDGPSVQRVLALIARVDGIVGASITEHAPPDDADDDDVVRRIGEAIVARMAG
jgi:arginase